MGQKEVLPGEAPDDAAFRVLERRESEALTVCGFPLVEVQPIWETWEPDGTQILYFYHLPDSEEEEFKDYSPTQVLRAYHGLEPEEDAEELPDEILLAVELLHDLHESQPVYDELLGVEQVREWDEEANCYKGGKVVPLVRIMHGAIAMLVPTNASPEHRADMERKAEEIEGAEEDE